MRPKLTPKPCAYCGKPFRPREAKQKNCGTLCGRLGLRRPFKERLLSKINRGAPDQCWPWIGKRNRSGYGMIVGPEGKEILAHRAIWALEHPEDVFTTELVIRHKVCDNPPCCNPAHLASGTNMDNLRDMWQKGRHHRGETHYWKSHPDKVLRGEQSGMARLTNDQVREIRRLAAIGHRQGYAIARKLGISPRTVNAIIRRQTWAHLD